MSAGKYLVRLVLPVAALASIATSQVSNDWFLDENAALDALALDDPGPTRTIAIQGVLTSREPLIAPRGGVLVHLELRARDVTGVRPAEVTAVLASERRPLDAERQVISVVPGGVTVVDLLLPAWMDCGAQPCIEDFTLSLRRTALDEDPIVDVTGTVTFEMSGDGGDIPPSGTQLELDVSDLGPVP